MPTQPSFRENLYFLEKNASRREELRRRLDESARRLEQQAAIAESLETDDQALIEAIHELGFDGETARVFDVLPLVHVSWADGRVQREERAAILAILEGRGIDPGSDASLLVESMLEHRPSDAFLRKSLDLLKALVARKGDAAAKTVDLCIQVAEASGGLLGFGDRKSPEERKLIAQVAEVLGDRAQARFREHLDG